MKEDFDVIYNILYYIYINKIIFSNMKFKISFSKFNISRIYDMKNIYTLIHRLKLANLQIKVFRFLKSMYNMRNIITRVLSKFILYYKKLRKIYKDYFKEH